MIKLLTLPKIVSSTQKLLVKKAPMTEFISKNTALIFVGTLWLLTLVSLNQHKFLSEAMLVDPVVAQTATPAPQTPAAENADSEIQNINAAEIEGTVLRIEGQTLAIETDDGVKTVTVADNVSLNRNGTAAAFSDLEVNDDVRVLQTEAGEVLSVTATSAEVETAEQFGIPLLLLGVLVIAAFMFFKKKMGEQHIKTEVGQVGNDNR